MSRMHRATRTPGLISTRRPIAVCLALAALVGLATPARAGNSNTKKVVTYRITNDAGNRADAKAYAVMIRDITPDMVDLTKTKGKLLNTVRLEPRTDGSINGTILIFENAQQGIKPGDTDDIQIYVKDLPARQKALQFSNISTLRSDVGRDAPVIQDDVERVGFQVEKDPEYTILNALDQAPFTVDFLQYIANVDEVEDTSMFLDFSNPFSFLDLNPRSTTVDLVGSPILHVPGPVDFGKWFYVRGIATIEGREVPFVHGSTEYLTNVVPEPAAAALLLLGATTLGGGALLMRRKVHAARSLAHAQSETAAGLVPHGGSGEVDLTS